MLSGEENNFERIPTCEVLMTQKIASFKTCLKINFLNLDLLAKTKAIILLRWQEGGGGYFVVVITNFVFMF